MSRYNCMQLIIVEDDPVLLNHLKLLLGGEKDVAVAGAFNCAEDALLSIHTLMPDIMLIDIGLPGKSGVELIRDVKAARPEINILAHTVFEDRKTVFAAIKAGASGYILKGATPRQLIEAVHELHCGGAPMSPKIARALIKEFQDYGMSEQYLLTKRETEIVKALEGGMSYKEIALRHDISSHTVHTHIKNIYEKLHAGNRRDLLIKARQKGIV